MFNFLPFCYSSPLCVITKVCGSEAGWAAVAALTATVRLKPLVWSSRWLDSEARGIVLNVFDASLWVRRRGERLTGRPGVGPRRLPDLCWSLRFWCYDCASPKRKGKKNKKKNRHTNIEYFVVFKTADFNFCGCFGLDGPLGGRVFTSEVDI